MAKIHYKKIKILCPLENGIITVSEIDNENRESLTLSITPKDYTHVIIGEKRYKLKSGAAEISPDEIPNGISEVAFMLGTKKALASPILKENGILERAPIDQRTALAIEKALTAVTEAMLDINERLDALEDITKPKNMFNFN